MKKKRSLKEILDELVNEGYTAKDVEEAKGIIDDKINRLESCLSFVKDARKVKGIIDQLRSDLESLRSLSESMRLFIELRKK